MPTNKSADDAMKAFFDATIGTDTVALDLAKKVGEDVFTRIMSASEMAGMASPLPRSILALMMSTATLHAACKAHTEVLMAAGEVSPDQAAENLLMLVNKSVAKLKAQES